MRKPGTGKVFRRTLKAKDGSKDLPYWYYWYIDIDGRKKTRKGYTDKLATEEALRTVQRRIARQLEGMPVPSEGVARKPLKEHLAAFVEHLEARAVTRKHLSLTVSRLKKAFAGMNASVFADLSSSKGERFLLSMRSEGVSKKTCNDYCAALRQFGAWVSNTNGWADPLKDLVRLPGKDDVRVRRMALSPDQLRRLFEAAGKRGVVRYLEQHPNAKPRTMQRLRRLGLERAMIYKIGALAGLRPNETKNLSWGCLDLDASPPTCVIEAKYAKSRRKATIPLNSALVHALREWRDFCTEELGRQPRPSEKVVRIPRHLTDREFRKDCEFAGLPLKDETGMVLDLYAATRHTFCTLLGQSGVAPHKQRLLMRHASLETTLQYTHLQVLDLVDGTEALSELMSPVPQNRAEHMRNGGCFSAQDAADLYKIANSEESILREIAEVIKDLPLQDLASSCNEMQGVSTCPLQEEEWWRRRESNPRPVTP